ncbi:MAG TPA: TonB family protein [Acidobacteriaceae bacterium]
MFLSSQLIEISQRFQSDVEDLQVLLQEEGLPVRSAECLEELSARLISDPRLRGDLAFIVRSMLYREWDQPGSMDVLGVLVVAAEGTRPELDTAPRQQLLRDLLRFVMQQRHPEASPAARPAAAVPVPVATEAESYVAAPAPVSPRLAIRPERSSPVPVPSLVLEEREPIWRRAHAVWIVLLLAGLGVGLAVRHIGSKATTPAPIATAPPAALPANPPVAENPAAAEPERPFVPESPRLKRTRKPLRPAPRAASRRVERPEESVPAMAATRTPPKPVPSLQPAQPSPQPVQPSSQPAQSNLQPAPANPRPALQALTPNPAQPVLHRRDYAPGTPSAGSAALASAAPASGNVFAHPEAAAASANQTPPPAFSRPKDPVLIARNNPAASAVKPELQGSVHTGSTGSMASNLMYSPEPDYPAGAIAAGVEGEVTVRAVVGPLGNVIDARVVSGPPLLRDAALQAVGRWRYRPYEQDGKPVAVATTAIVDFQMPPKK